jgi:hypothetical protein
MQHPEISWVTWSSKGIRVVYSDSMIVHLSEEDMYPFAVPADVIATARELTSGIEHFRGHGLHQARTPDSVLDDHRSFVRITGERR